MPVKVSSMKTELNLVLIITIIVLLNFISEREPKNFPKYLSYNLPTAITTLFEGYSDRLSGSESFYRLINRISKGIAELLANELKKLGNIVFKERRGRGRNGYTYNRYYDFDGVIFLTRFGGPPLRTILREMGLIK